jgi:thiopurine S-methyltransferase
LVRAAYDRAALVALPADLRAGYARQFAQLMPSGSKSLLVGFEYDEKRKPGPPFSVDAEEIARLYGSAFEIKALERVDIIESSPKFAAAGVVELFETLYALTRR